MKRFLLYHADLENKNGILEYYLDSFETLIETVQTLCNYQELDRVFILINDDYFENGGSGLYEIFDLYMTDQVHNIIRQLTMMYNTDSFKYSPENPNFINISIHECDSYEEAYIQSLDLMETSHNCYIKNGKRNN